MFKVTDHAGIFFSTNASSMALLFPPIGQPVHSPIEEPP
jgi:hypothetical protein